MSRVRCPFCGQRIDVWVDEGGGDEQEYIEDCSVCCRPLRIVADRDGPEEPFRIVALRE